MDEDKIFLLLLIPAMIVYTVGATIDIVTTYVILQHPNTYEVNEFARVLMESYGLMNGMLICIIIELLAVFSVIFAGFLFDKINLRIGKIFSFTVGIFLFISFGLSHYNAGVFNNINVLLGLLGVGV